MAAAGSGRRLCTVPERAKLHMALAIYQFGYSGNHIIFQAALNMGVSKLVLPLYRNSIAVLLLFPFAYVLEKKDRPPLTISFLIQFFLLGLVGIAFNHLSYMLGLNYTRPTFASAIENSVPAVTFLLATLFRLEQVRLDRRDGKAKVLGTLASVSGASIITLYKGPVIYSPSSSATHLNQIICYPALMQRTQKIGSWVASIVSYTAYAGVFERDSNAWQVHSVGELLCILYAGVVSSGIAFAIQIWVVDKAGPVFFSLYLPIQTMLVAIMAALRLGEEFYLGGVIGALLIIMGLYLVVWGKNEERKLGNDEFESLSHKGMCSSQSSLVQTLLTAS
ncbi:hypothetical protein FNV43_RR19031 [Rhamnella rubrinervis]|uniref:WAT1-related protein n=1 Tax=Rhamnella rubrinervis TaxID=2594499 RepID=A0A8K0E7F7_9ROSA|nr:hypothetical protein FNV43_RR19031 [Rhamnella rubrinervis]